ncbi:Fur family transcriptional regulator [Tepidibacillus fermentans]|uniref:Fur family peroxide stress response transcriptional regulator n=1 Tax=Tepidibacillus fermentans TaxID=1281767 RepID=A0A4R3K9Z9_9BACI|nr:Fur family transcriptional regulator [Tepidibacillus fermentans]TCS79894.1 Fur family peroxide stress response transcriptional regulator [Tepidibacillus fermentans]
MINDLRKALEERDIEDFRFTPQRVAIYHYLSQSDKHPTAEEIFKELKKKFPSMSIATIYNNLKAFKYAGLVQELALKNTTRFELNSGFHYHVICQHCGEIKDLHYPVFEDVQQFAKQHTGFQIYSHSIEFQGICETCQAEGNMKKTS